MSLQSWVFLTLFLPQAHDPAAGLPFLANRFDGSLVRPVVDLLVEQVECADVILLNKADLVSDDDLARLRAVVSALNTKAKIYACTYGDATLDRVLAVAGDDGAAALGPVDEHKVAVAASKAANAKTADASHAHDDEEGHSCSEPACTDPTHDHSHASSGHARDEAAAEEPCFDAACTDPTHDHSHSSHAHAHGHEKNAHGIESFVYARRRPFAPERLGAVLRDLPADVSAAFEAASGAAAAPRAEGPVGDALARLVRSKGFLWLASSHDAAYYWSHAGAFFNAELLGRWWATLPEEHWPEDLKDSIVADFDGDDGDRRQEIVFIGLDLLDKQQTIEDALDACLLTDAELAAYRGADEASLPGLFPSDLRVKA